MMNLNNESGLIDLNTWQLLLEQLPNLERFHAQSIKKIIDYIPQEQNVTNEALITLMCGDSSRFSEVFYFYQEAAKRKYAIEVYLPKELTDAFAQYMQSKQCLITPIDIQTIAAQADRFVFVDLLTNLVNRNIPDFALSWITQMNSQDIPVITIDCPAGLDATTGKALIIEPLHVDFVISRIAFMQGLFTGVAKEYIRHYLLQGDSFNGLISYQSYLLNHEQIEKLLPKKIAHAYKGMYSRVLIFAGEKEMFGASVLAARAALIMGSGWVEVFYQPGSNPPIASLAEIIWQELTDINKMCQDVREDDILVFGPGLGEGSWGKNLWQALSNLPNRMVVDAGALHYLAKHPKKVENWVITPHPGEAADLLNCSSQDIQSDRFKAIRELYQTYAAGIVLKGSGSLILTLEQQLYLCPHGNPAMASPGMGDVLTGLIAGLWAHMGNQASAICLGVWLHAKAADAILARNPEMLAIRATQVLDEIENHMQDLL